MENLADISVPSTVIDVESGPSAAGGGVVQQPAEEPSLRDTIAGVFSEDAKAKEEPKPAKAEPKAEEPAKDDAKAESKTEGKQRDPAGKFAPAEKPAVANEQDDAPAPKQDQDKQSRYPEPPSRFMPDSREVWRNVPRSVQRDIEAMARDHETEVQRYRESHERWEGVRQYDELARSNGRGGVHESLAKVVEIERALQANPIAGLNKILMEVGPRKADGQPLSLWEVANHIVQQGQQGYQQMAAPPQQQTQQPQEDPRVNQLVQELQNMKLQQLESQIIDPFKVDHPRYSELEQDIAFFLSSGRIPRNLSDIERLEVAYDMAARMNPASHVPPEINERPDPARRADDGFSGSKSIKSAPGSVSEDVESEASDGESIRDSLRKEMRRLNRA